MSHADHPETGITAHPPAPSAVFAPAEIEAFHADDRSAATAIVGLMAGIFIIGLLGYTAVCRWVVYS